ncbi:MAG: cbb3-type cytochrome c oxidase subunit 3 [Dokdonella sp.]
MNPLWGQIAGFITVSLLVVFIGIWIWAWRPWHKKSFDEMAQIPMQDKDAPEQNKESEDATK